MIESAKQRNLLSFMARLLAVPLLASITTACGSEAETKPPAPATLLQAAEVRKTVQAGNVRRVREMAARHRGLAQHSFGGERPLHWAANAGQVAMIKELIRLGADPNVQTRSLRPYQGAYTHYRNGCQTPLLLAAQRGHTEIARLLLEANADADAKDQFGMTPLHHAAVRGHQTVLDLLIKHGVDIDAHGSHPPRWAELSYFSGFGSSQTPLHLAATQPRVEIVRKLLAAGASVRARTSQGSTPLHIAVQRQPKALAIARVLIEAGSGVNAVDAARHTPLHYAVKSENMSALLRSKGARLNIIDAVSLGDLEVLKARLDEKPHWVHACGGIGRSAVFLATISSRFDVADILVARGALIDSMDDQGWTPLTFATRDGRKEICKYLLEKGADPNLRSTVGPKRYSALHFAAMRGRTEVARLLIEAGAEVDVGKGETLTPLMRAVAGGHPETVKLLLASRADPNACDRDGNTVLKIALQHRRTVLIELLKRHGAKE